MLMGVLGLLILNAPSSLKVNFFRICVFSTFIWIQFIFMVDLLLVPCPSLVLTELYS